jgi:hypothetical protein
MMAATDVQETPEQGLARGKLDRGCGWGLARGWVPITDRAECRTSCTICSEAGGSNTPVVRPPIR